MIRRFEFSDFDGFQDLETFYKLFAVCLLDADYEHLIFDLRGVRFMTPEALLSLVCASKVWSTEKGSSVQWQMNDNDVLGLGVLDAGKFRKGRKTLFLRSKTVDEVE
jgi:hypothetical protein